MELHRAVDKVGIIVRNVYDGGAALEFNLPLSDTLRALKLQIQSHLQEKPHPHEQKLIFCGKVWDDGVRLGEILSKMDISSPQTFHLVLSRQQARKRESRPTVREEHKVEETQLAHPPLSPEAHPSRRLCFDPRSLEVARSELESPGALLWAAEARVALRRALQASSMQEQPVLHPPRPAVSVQANGGAPAGAVGAVGAVRWLDLKLLLKIFAALFIFGQGASLLRFTLLVTVAFCYYIVQTGIWEFVHSGFASERTLATHPYLQSFVSAIAALGSGTIPREVGWHYDVVSFFASACLSLVPSMELNLVSFVLGAIIANVLTPASLITGGTSKRTQMQLAGQSLETLNHQMLTTLQAQVISDTPAGV